MKVEQATPFLEKNLIHLVLGFIKHEIIVYYQINIQILSICYIK